MSVLFSNIPTDYARSYSLDGSGANFDNTNNATPTNALWIKSYIGYQSQCLSWGATTSLTYASVTYTNSYIWIYSGGAWSFEKNNAKVTATALNGVNGERYAMLKFYNRTLTTDEEDRLKLEGLRKLGPSNIASYPKLFDGLVGYWDFKGTAHNIVDGVLATNTSVTSGTDHLGNTGILNTYNGSSNYIDASIPVSIFSGTQKFTFISWIKTSDIGNVKSIFGWANASANFNDLVGIQKSSANKLRLIRKEGSPSIVYKVADSTTSINTGNWICCGGTYDGSNLRVYINGVLEGTTASTGSVVVESGNVPNLRIGRNGDYSPAFQYWIGNIENSLIFLKEFSDNEMKQLYDLTSSNYIYPVANYDLPNLREGLVLDLNEQGKDLSGNGNNGTLVNSPTVVRQGKVKGLSYNGSNQYIDNIGINNITLGNNDKTLSSWIRPGYTQDKVIHCLGNSATNNQLGIALHLSNEIKAYIYGGPNILSGITATKIHHIVLSKKGNDYKLYVDGILRNTTTYTSLNLSGTQHQVGALGTSSFNGSILSSRIWNRALSDKEVQQLYYSQKGNFIY